MNTTIYYCHECASEIYNPIDISEINLTGSLYQLGKFIKHTIAKPLLGITSSYYDTSYSAYNEYTINALASGSLEVIKQGDNIKYNYVYFADKNIGCQYINGKATMEEDAVKVVLTNDRIKIHSFSTGSFGIQNNICTKCGKSLIY